MRSSIIILSLLLLACDTGDRKPKQNLEALRKKEPLMTGYGPVVKYTEGGSIKAHIQARFMFQNFDPDTRQTITEAQNSVHMKFYDEQGKQQSSLTSDRAILNPHKKLVEAIGNVIVTTKEGDIIETEHLFYQTDKKKVYTNQFTKITRETEIILADSLVSTDNMAQYNIYNISGTIQLNE